MDEPKLPVENCDSKPASDFDWFILFPDEEGVLSCEDAPYVAVKVFWDSEGNQHPFPAPYVDEKYRKVVYAWQEVFESALATSKINGWEHVVLYEPLPA